MDKLTALKQYFGHDGFRPGQQALVDGLLAGRDVFGVMPTGGGKSVCYQLPALLRPGVTLVISPLISLMKDQVAALEQAGVPAACLNSSLDNAEMAEVMAKARGGAYKLLYIAPERLASPGFRALAAALTIPVVAVDEAHCISQWGQDFRPGYLAIADFIAALPRRPAVAAFTATATAQVRADIVRLLRLDDPVEVVTGFDRPNLYFDVLRPKSKKDTLLALLEQRRGKSGIVYCATRANVEKVCDALCAAGLPATRYHAGLPDAERRRNQDDFQFDRRPVMVATNAFGMGIDKSNVSFVIHYNMPQSLEAYYQEAGRAGRDGSPADCILLFSPADIATARYFIENGGGNEALTPEERAAVRAQDYRRLDAMAAYCRTTGCLRGAILDYFGQPHAERCGNCGPCRAPAVDRDVTVQAQMVLSCAARIRQKLGYPVGENLLIEVLRGGGSQRLRQLGLDGVSTYGLMKQVPRGEVRRLVEYLEERGFLHRDPAHGGVSVTGQAGELLFHGGTLTMPVRAGEAPALRPGRKAGGAAAPAADADAGLLAALKAERLRLAQAGNVPAYIVFSNAVLEDMAARCPRTMDEFLEVSGVGAVKAQRYGENFLHVIEQYAQDTAGQPGMETS